jgi:tetratricopeptide (TPR) repeat protein
VKHRLVFIGALLYGSSFALQASAAGDAPSVEEVKAAESDFNKGREAYKAGNYDEAAEYFESADGHAPNERVLELAINARDKAGHLDRAATSAELALELYPNAARIKKVAVPIVDRAKTELLTVIVNCDEACNLLDGSRLVHGENATRRVVFLTPGDHEIRASWSDDRVLTQQVTGKSGETQNLDFKAPPIPKKPDVPVAQQMTPMPGGDRGAEEKPHGMPPIVFLSGVGLTAVLGGVTIWSGIDTTKNPGADAVRAACQTPSRENCGSLYDEGINHQRRTNILIAATSVVGAATAVIGGFFTNWSGKKAPEADTARITPFVTYGDGPTVGATGRF